MTSAHTLATALRIPSPAQLARFGQRLPLFPCGADKRPLTAHGFHDACQDAAAIAAWWEAWPDALVGVPTGTVSGIVVLDIDPGNLTDASREWLERHTDLLMHTRVHHTLHDDGRHYIFRAPGVPTRCCAAVVVDRQHLPGIDVRGDGGYAIWWPAHGLSSMGEIQPLPDALLPLFAAPRGNGSNYPPANTSDETIGPGHRNDYLSKEAYRLRRQGAGLEQIERLLLGINAVRCTPPLELEEVRQIARGKERIARAPAAESQESQPAREKVKSVPEPLRRELPPAAPYPLDALGPILSAAARRTHEITQAPAAIVGQSFLAAASLAVQAHADVEIDGRRELLSTNHGTIGVSGERKSEADRVALYVHREFERTALKEFDKELKKYEIELEAYEAAKKLICKARPEKDVTAVQLKENITDALKKLGGPPVMPKKPIFFMSEPTLEGLHKLFAAGRPSVGLFHDDAGEFIGGHAMSDDNRMKSAAGFSRLWDRGEFDRVRAGDGANKYFGRRLALHLMMQPIIAEQVLSDDILTQQGLLARTLLAWPESTIGDRPYVEEDVIRDPALVDYYRAVSAVLSRPLRFAEGSTEELNPPLLQLTPQAKRAWVLMYNAIEADQKDGADYASIRPWASKAPAQILRIAGVLTILEHPDASEIDAEVIDRATVLMRFYLSEAVRIVGTSAVPEQIRHAQALLEWCHREQKAEIHSREALQYGPYCIRSSESFDRAIAVLERKGWVIQIEGGKEIDGVHRRRVWAVWTEGL